jgi:cytochrome c peroxidase
MWWSTVAIGFGLLGCACDSSKTSTPWTKEELGEPLFNDPRLSEPAGQACSDCHDPGFAFSDPEDERTSMGVVEGRFASRNAQPVMYASHVPALHRDPQTQQLVGGLFWDGAANSLEEQALKPLLNPLEMNNPDKATVVAKIRKYYAKPFRALFGKHALDDVDRAFAHVGEAIAAFERMPAFAPFASKYDRYLAGATTLEESEARGLAIFEDPARGNCASCHWSRPGADGRPPLFTNFAYANLGIPKFANNPFYTLPQELNPAGMSFVDHGLMTITGEPSDDGKFRVPTLRNVMRTGPYGHNGYFRRLDEMIELKTGSCMREGTCNWAEPEVPATAHRVVSGRRLAPHEIADLVAFLRTLTDEVLPPPPPPR